MTKGMKRAVYFRLLSASMAMRANKGSAAIQAISCCDLAFPGIGLDRARKCRAG